MIGTIADYGFKDCKDLFSKLKFRTREDLWNSKYGRVVEKISTSGSILGPTKIFKILNNANSLNSLDKNSQINLAVKKYSKFFKKAKEEFDKNLEKFDNVNLIF